MCLCVKEGLCPISLFGVHLVGECQLYDPNQLQNEISRIVRMCKVYTDVGDTRLALKKLRTIAWRFTVIKEELIYT